MANRNPQRRSKHSALYEVNTEQGSSSKTGLADGLSPLPCKGKGKKTGLEAPAD